MSNWKRRTGRTAFDALPAENLLEFCPIDFGGFLHGSIFAGAWHLCQIIGYAVCIMLKRLAILAAIITLAPFVGIASGQKAPPNTPKKGVVEGNGTVKTQPSQTGQHENQSAPNQPSVVVQVEAPSVESSRTDGHEDKATQKLAGSTFWLMVFTGGLIVVGILQAIALILQVVLLGVHGSHLHNLADAARKSADAANSQVEMIKRKERARLVVRPHAEPGPGFVIEDDQGHTVQALDVRIEIANEGETGAFNVSASGRYLAVSVSGSCDISSGFKLDIPTIIRPATPESPIVVSIYPLEGDIASIPADD